MRGLVGLLLVFGSLVGTAMAKPSAATTTVVHWSPFLASGELDPSLRVKTVEGGCGDIGYSLIGGIGYRCGWANYLITTCFRDGPEPTDYVICAVDPWSREVIRIHSRWLTYYPGVTFSPDTGLPWALQLQDGNRCLAVLTGASSIPTPTGQGRSDYICRRGGIELSGIKRDHGLWKTSAVSWSAKAGYGTPKFVRVRRAYFGSLPPSMARQNVLAGTALQTATRLIHRHRPRARLDLAWVRLALPNADWAYVIFTPADASFRGYFALLHLVDGRWTDASGYTPYCTRLPKRAAEQLFLPKMARNFRRSGMEPRGETRC